LTETGVIGVTDWKEWVHSLSTAGLDESGDDNGCENATELHAPRNEVEEFTDDGQMYERGRGGLDR
jgi:hypothetical protein